MIRNLAVSGILTIWMAGFSIAQEIPLWITDTGTAYPESAYLVMTGTGSDPEAARQDAIVRMTAYFGIKISHQGESSTIVTVMNGQDTLESRLTEKVKTLSEHELYTLACTPAILYEGEWKVLAVLDRAAAIRAWKSELDNRKSAFRACLSGAPALPIRLVNIRKARAILQGMILLEKDLALLSGMDGTDGELASMGQDLDRSEGEIREEARIQVTVHGDAGGNLEGLMVQELTKAGFLQGAGGQLTLEVDAVTRTRKGSYGLKTGDWSLVLQLRCQGATFQAIHLQGRCSASGDDALTARMEDAMEKDFLEKGIPGILDQFTANP